MLDVVLGWGVILAADRFLVSVFLGAMIQGQAKGRDKRITVYSLTLIKVSLHALHQTRDFLTS